MGGRPYLLEVLEQLWPGEPPPEVQRGRREIGNRHSFLALPGGRSPTVLVPVARTAAAAALRAYGGHGSRTSRLRTRVAGGVMASGLGALLFRDRVSVAASPGGISEELERVLGVPVQLAVRVGPPRANRKPVLAALDGGGRIVAFAKIGTTPLTERLVQVESETLQRLAATSIGTVRAPRALHTGAWRDMALLVQEALPVESSRPVKGAMLVRAVQDVAGVFGITTLTWGASDHAREVRRRLERIPAGETTVQLRRAVDVLASHPQPLPVGAWHGDWTSWNCAAVDGAVLAWDWERFATGVPLGFDLLHFSLQASLTRAGVPTRRQPEALLSTAAEQLRVLGLSQEQATVTAVAYLVEMASRYLVDDQAAAGAAVGHVEHWLLPVIAEAVRHLPSPHAEEGK